MKFNDTIKNLLEDFNIYPQPKIPGTYQGKNIYWGKKATTPSGFKGDSFNTSSSQIIFSLPVKNKKKKKKSLNIRKKRVSTNRVGR